MSKRYDIYTFEMYTWIAVPPNPIFMKDNDKHEEYLNKLISAHKFKMEIDKELLSKEKRLMTENRDQNVKNEGLLENSLGK